MSTAIAEPSGTIERVLVQGDLARLTADERAAYYLRVCDSLGLNHLTQPFAYITLNGKLVLYARRECTEQLRKLRGISVVSLKREVTEGVYVVTAAARDPDGRTDESIGAVPIEGLKGEARANAMMKAESKAKRRVTLSLAGLGMLDETEVESAQHAAPAAPARPAAIEHKPTPAPAREPGDDDAEVVTQVQLNEIRELNARENGGPGLTWAQLAKAAGCEGLRPEDLTVRQFFGIRNLLRGEYAPAAPG